VEDIEDASDCYENGAAIAAMYEHLIKENEADSRL
jgi:hypothetical protein